MMAFERRWAEAVLSGFAPATSAGLAPAPGDPDVDYRTAMHEMMARGTTLSALGMRIALFIAALAPFWMSFRFCTFVSLAPDERARFLVRLLGHRIFLVRELMLLLKLCACMALFRSADVRARSGYDGSGEDAMDDAALISRERVRLPIATGDRDDESFDRDADGLAREGVA